MCILNFVNSIITKYLVPLKPCYIEFIRYLIRLNHRYLAALYAAKVYNLALACSTIGSG